MNAARAKRRWLRWCRYRAATHSARNDGLSHLGASKAFADVHFARRCAPGAGKKNPHAGARSPYFPKWASW